MPLTLKNFKFSSSRASRKARKHEHEFIQSVKEDDIEVLKKLTKDKIQILAAILWEEEYAYPIHIGCALGSLEVVKLLFRIGCSLETKTDSGMTPLHYACCYNNTHPEVIEHLLDMGAKPNVKDKIRGYTPFHYASESNNYGAAKKLLEVTKRFTPDNEGNTAKDIAIENDCDQIVGLFEAYDEECKQKEQLMRLPGRIDELERKTSFLLRNSSIQSVNDSGVEGSNNDVNLSGQNLISLHVDDSFDGRQRRRSSSTVSLYKASTKLATLSISEEQYNTLVKHHSTEAVNGNRPPSLHLSISPNTTDTERSFHPNIQEEETPTPQPVTRESPLGRLHRNQVVRHYSFLNSMIKPDKIIIKLFSKKHIDLDTKERLAKMQTQQDKNDHILTNHILKGSMGMYEDFLLSLKDSDQGHIANKLLRVNESPLYKTGDELSLTQVKKESIV